MQSSKNSISQGGPLQNSLGCVEVSEPPGAEVMNSGGASCTGVIMLPTKYPVDLKTGHNCSECGKSFRRKTILDTHSKSCTHIKNEVNKMPDLLNRLNIPEKEEDFSEVLTQFCGVESLDHSCGQKRYLVVCRLG